MDTTDQEIRITYNNGSDEIIFGYAISDSPCYLIIFNKDMNPFKFISNNLIDRVDIVVPEVVEGDLEYEVGMH